MLLKVAQALELMTQVELNSIKENKFKKDKLYRIILLTALHLLLQVKQINQKKRKALQIQFLMIVCW
jgi:hypothetical protein